MRKKITDAGSEYIHTKDSDSTPYTMFKSTINKNKFCLCTGLSLLLSRKKALELSKILAYFGNTGELPEVNRGYLSMTMANREQFNPVRKENDIKPVKQKKPFVYFQTCTYCEKYKEVLQYFECGLCGQKIRECRACHRLLPPEIRNKKICQDCFDNKIQKFNGDEK